MIGTTTISAAGLAWSGTLVALGLGGRQERTAGMVTSPMRRLPVDPSSQSTAHAEACSVIVERVDMELGTFG